jgi:hypothetical protein
VQLSLQQKRRRRAHDYKFATKNHDGEDDDDADTFLACKSKKFKSHLAYWVLIRAVLLGERIKITRRHTDLYYHVPVWDVLWHLDQRRDFYDSGNRSFTSNIGKTAATTARNGDSVPQCLERLRRLILEPSALQHPLVYGLPPAVATVTARPIYIVGDSHVLSLAWQYLCISGILRIVIPMVVTGLKAWHIRPETRFFTHTGLQTMIRRLLQRQQDHSPATTIVISAGEIDCREGIGGPVLEGYNTGLGEEQHRVERTVKEYVAALRQVVSAHADLAQILVMPVPAHCRSRKGRVKGRAVRRETTRLWNQALRQQLPIRNDFAIFFLDYEAALLDGSQDYVLRPAFNADSTHMNAAFARHFEQAVVECGCNLDLL